MRRLLLLVLILLVAACAPQHKAAPPADPMKAQAPQAGCLVAEPAAAHAEWAAYEAHDAAAFTALWDPHAQKAPTGSEAQQFIEGQAQMGVSGIEWIASCAAADGSVQSFYIMHAKPQGHPLDIPWALQTDAQGKVIDLQ